MQGTNQGNRKMDKRRKLTGSSDYAGTRRLEGISKSDQTLSLRDILHVIFKRKVQIFVFFLTVVLTVVIATLLITPTYQATAKILVKIERENINRPANVMRLPGEMQINSEIQMLRSRSLAEKVITDLSSKTIYPKTDAQDHGLYQKYIRRFKDEVNGILEKYLPRKQNPLPTADKGDVSDLTDLPKFQAALSITAIKNTNLIKVQFSHKDPNMAAKVVNRLADIYLDHHLTVYKTPKFNKFIEEQTRLLEKKLEQSETKLELLKKQSNIISLDEERSLLLKEEAALRADLNRTLSLVVETERRIHKLKQQLSATPKTIQKSEEINHNQDLINALEVKLMELELKEIELRRKYTAEIKEVKDVKNEIRIIEEKLAEKINKPYATKQYGINPTYRQTQAELFRYESDLKALHAKKKAQKAQLIEYHQRLEKLNRIEGELNQLQQMIDVDGHNYRLYLTKFEESRISDAMDSEKITSVSLIEPAQLPLYPVSPKPMLNFILAVLLGTFGGLGVAFFLNFLDDSLEMVEDVEESLQLPVLASIPVLKK
jgi:uncharacterized protein involved in exopolysaccharide biosynthesis